MSTFVSRYGNSTVNATATVIVEANNHRRGVILTNNSTVTIYIGMDENVTTSNGFPITSGGIFATNDGNGVWRGNIYGVSTSGSCDVRFWEFGS